MHHIIILTLLSSIGFASPQEDSQAIKSMSGCFEVKFNFIETFVTDPTYPVKSLPYTETALEWVTVDLDSTNEVHLQHILVIPGGSMKHWRQEWRYESRDIWAFMGRKDFDNTDSSLIWQKTKTFPIKGYWTQTVTQVDDSPRYECSAPWIHYGSTSYWECKAPAPLPRREFTKRNDYDILNRRNRHSIEPWGWMHEQDNEKIISKNKSKIAEEKGYNSYTKVSEDKCKSAADWWGTNKPYWNAIQNIWHNKSLSQDLLVLKPKYNGNSLWMELFSLTDLYSSKLGDIGEMTTKAENLILNFEEPQ
jgi:hypothetical protein